MPRIFATESKTFAALSVQANGKKLPVASAKPATSPERSWVDVLATANAVPLVPSEITRSPKVAPTPSAPEALSPAPAEIFILPLSKPNSFGAVILGR